MSNPMAVGERIQLTDTKQRKYTIQLQEDSVFHTHHGAINHNDLIGKDQGIVVYSNNGTPFLALRPLLIDYMLSMPRGAQVIYPKDAAQIILEGDIYPGATVLEAGAGSGALTCNLLRAVGESGKVISYEIREDHAKFAKENVEKFFHGKPDNWELIIDDVTEIAGTDRKIDRVILDMLSPWEVIPKIAENINPGGVLIVYIATTTQLSKVAETIRAQKNWTEPRSWETMLRNWHVVDLAVRPDHRMHAHTGFLLRARKLSPGVIPPDPKRRPTTTKNSKLKWTIKNENF